MLSPSQAIHQGDLTLKVPRALPSLALSLVTVLSKLFDTQMFAPSKVTPSGFRPTSNAPKTSPSRALTLVTVPGRSAKFATQIFFPSKATPYGWLPTGTVFFTRPRCRFCPNAFDILVGVAPVAVFADPGWRGLSCAGPATRPAHAR